MGGINVVVKKKKKAAVKTKPVVKKTIKNKAVVKKSNVEKKSKSIKILNKKIDLKEYFEYYSLVVFFLFSILFVFILIVVFIMLFGKQYLWTVIPVTIALWIASYYLSRYLFKKSKK